MDLMDRIAALTDDQLQMVAQRDDATGVLAEYQLALLRGLPVPQRTAAILCDGYIILAQGNGVERIPITDVMKIITHGDEGYCVLSHDGSHRFGCYPTLEEARARLDQIHQFRNAREGSFVSWGSGSGVARGQIERIVTEGSIDVPDSSFTITAEPDDPAALIRVWQERADGWQPSDVLVGHKVSTLRSIEPLAKESFRPPNGVREAAQRALRWIADGHAGSGFTDVGRRRASQLASGQNVSRETIGRMASYFGRHSVDAQATGWNAGEEGFPSPGRVAWDAWGGDAGQSWASSIMGAEKSTHVPLSETQSAQYEALELIVELHGKFDQGTGEAGAHYMAPAENSFNEEGLNCANCVFYAGGGGCEIVEGPVEAGGLCKFWVIPENLIQKASNIVTGNAFLRKSDEKMFTLGPLYVPDFMDAHGEWTDSDELQRAVWEWVKSGDRSIYLQHNRGARAGEWVEVMTMPQPWTVEMQNAAGQPLGQVTYPTGTVFLGVHWDAPAWELVKEGKLRGYSIGGLADRMMVDLPNEAIREGVFTGDE
jgi:hypothetical protein